MTLLAALLAITVHEWAHAWTADRQGDPTPWRFGRVSLNPIAHVQLWGWLLALVTWWAFALPVGWGRPVPMDRRYLDRRGYLLAVAAGPASNLVLALLLWPWWSDGALVSLGIGAVNLLPVRPLDGYQLVREWRRRPLRVVEWDRGAGVVTLNRPVGDGDSLDSLAHLLNTEMGECRRCGGERWVCEEHTARPMGHDDCGGAGDPCPGCNPLAGEV